MSNFKTKQLKNLISFATGMRSIKGPPHSHFLHTDTGKKYVKKAFKSCEFLQQWPFGWDEKSDRPKYVTSFRGTFCWILSGILCTLLWSFCVFRFIQLFCQDVTPTSKVIYMIVITTLYSIPVVGYVSLPFCGQDIVDTLNLAMDYFPRYEGK